MDTDRKRGERQTNGLPDRSSPVNWWREGTLEKNGAVLQSWKNSKRMKKPTSSWETRKRKHVLLKMFIILHYMLLLNHTLSSRFTSISYLYTNKEEYCTFSAEFVAINNR